VKHALDYFCDSVDPVGAGTGHLLHDGRVRPHPIGDRGDSSAGQSDSGAESLVAIPVLKGSFMRINPITLVGIALIVLAVVAFTYQEKTIPLSPLLGGLALVGGIVLVVVGAKKA